MSPSDLIAVVGQIRRLPGYPHFEAASPVYRHMGALLTDAGLQAGIKYNTVVQPRVRRILTRWPDAESTSGFLARVRIEGLRDVLLWENDVKLERIRQMAVLLESEGVQDVQQLSEWIKQPGNRSQLMQIKGIKDKTADYVANIAGHPVAAVDRHLRTFVASAGVNVTDYNEVHALLAAAADECGVSLGSLDRQIWAFMTGERQSRPDLTAPSEQSSAAIRVSDLSTSASAPRRNVANALTSDMREEIARLQVERDQARDALERLRQRLRRLLIEEGV